MAMNIIETYLDYINQNDQIVVLKINPVLGSHDTCHSLYDDISVELVIAPHRRSDGVLSLPS